MTAFLGATNELASRLSGASVVLKTPKSAGALDLGFIWGMPAFHSPDGTPDNIAMFERLFIVQLCWTASELNTLERRSQFPSWSWVGWKGAVTLDTLTYRQC
ncbi:putative tol protein [Rosellinia necatrix]|uniref:Putative tol protein n=1 Tax=Rosellinia necatrix TaxID=77044 RepID=A0A1S8A604_ROSNE|nr:putative tol protein [Rosellinia necatrix]